MSDDPAGVRDRPDHLPPPELTPHIAGGFSSTSRRYDDTVDANAMGARRLVASLPKETLPRALDVGCGTGFASVELVAHRGTRQVLGADPSEGMLEQYAAKLGAMPGVTVATRHATVEQMAVAPGSVDVAVSTMAFHWFPDRHAAASAMADAVRPGGLVAALAPARGSDQEFFDLAAAIDPPAPAEWALAARRFLVDPGEFEDAFRATPVDILDLWVERRHRRASPEAFLERMRTVATHVFLRTPGHPEQELEDAWDRTAEAIRRAAGPHGFEWTFNKVFVVARRR